MMMMVMMFCLRTAIGAGVGADVFRSPGRGAGLFGGRVGCFADRALVCHPQTMKQSPGTGYASPMKRCANPVMERMSGMRLTVKILSQGDSGGKQVAR